MRITVLNRRRGLVGLGLAVAVGVAGCGQDSATAAGDGGTVGTDGNGGQTVTLTMGPFNVPHGADSYHCQNFKNPFGGMDVEVASFESHMTTGSHHALLFFQPGGQNGPIEDCSGLEFFATPYSTQRPDFQVNYPDGVAALIPASQGLRINAHYVNTTNADTTATVTMILHLAKPGTVHDHAGTLFFSNVSLNIPPAGVSTQSASCMISPAINLLVAQSHMHHHGIGFVATSGSGQMLFQSNSWSDPPAGRFQPPIALPANTAIHWSCTYDNETGAAIHFGESAITDEMCIFAGQYYPVPTGATNPVLFCAQ
jgi:hypothetical protein